MSRYSLEVVSPFILGVPSEEANRLSFALESLATIHGGMVVEPSDALSRSPYRRQYVNIFDCEDSLGKEVEWLRREFPDTKFTLKEFMQPDSHQQSSQRIPTANQERPD
jgi:hypothetical protein